MKKCNKCKKTKDWDKFRKTKHNLDGYYGYCIECAKLDYQKYRDRKKEGVIKAF